MARLSDLEFCVLGIVWKKAPCTAYAVRKEFIESPSTHWSGSAGSIYPLVRRLEEKGLLRSVAGTRGRRPHRAYAITTAGRKELRQWISPPLPPRVAATTYSPLRTRMYFLAALRPQKQIEFLDNALDALRGEVDTMRSVCDRYRDDGDLFSRLASLSGLYALRSQIKWIDAVRKTLVERGT